MLIGAAAAIFALGVPGIPESVDLIAGAYIAVLAVILVYVAIMAVRLIHTQRELSELRRLVDERGTVAEAVCES